MEQQKKNIAITLQEAKEWYQSGNPTLKELVLKVFTKKELEKQDLPKTWEEHCLMCAQNKVESYYIDTDSSITSDWHTLAGYTRENRNLCQTKEDAEAFLALMQLRALWHDYVGDFEIDWTSHNYFSIFRSLNNKIIVHYASSPKTFCFPTSKLAEKFLTNFKDLFEIAKPLI